MKKITVISAGFGMLMLGIGLSACGEGNSSSNNAGNNMSDNYISNN